MFFTCQLIGSANCLHNELRELLPLLSLLLLLLLKRIIGARLYTPFWELHMMVLVLYCRQWEATSLAVESKTVVKASMSWQVLVSL